MDFRSVERRLELGEGCVIAILALEEQILTDLNSRVLRSRGDGILHYSIKHGYPNLVKKLLSYFSSKYSVMTVNHLGQNAFHYAVFYNKMEILTILLRELDGNMGDALRIQDKWGKIPIMYVNLNVGFQVFSLLMSNHFVHSVRLDVKDNDDRTVHHSLAASRIQYMSGFQLCTELGSCPREVERVMGLTPFDIAHQPNNVNAELYDERLTNA